MRSRVWLGWLLASVTALGACSDPNNGNDASMADGAVQDSARADVSRTDTNVVRDVQGNDTNVEPDVVAPEDTGPGEDASQPDVVVAEDVPTPMDVTNMPDTVVTMDVTNMPDVPMPMDVAVLPDTSMPDTSMPDTSMPDVPIVPGGLFDRCTGAAQCGGLGATAACLTFYPGGLCTRTCSSSAQCGAGNQCLDILGNGTSQCFPGCDSDPSVCSTWSSTCYSVGAGSTPRACFPTCWEPTRRPLSEPACIPSTTCNPWTGYCAGGANTALADNGQPCTGNASCRSDRCITELDAGRGTGWLGGYCYSTGRLTDIQPNQPLPQSTCPTGSVVIPSGSNRIGDVGICVDSCNTSADCRPGYGCDRLEFTMPAGAMTTTGFCAPIDCLMAGMVCPAGTRCDARAGTSGTYGVCIR